MKKLPDLMRANRLVSFAIGLGLILRVIYWEVTERKFEDGLITVAHAQSVADGIGLTHHPYEPVTHGFTTAISVLVPTVGELLSFLPKMDGFLMLRLVSLVAFGFTIVYADRIARALGVATWPRAFVLLFLAIDYNQIFYGMAGMETQIGVAILLGAVDATMRRKVVTAGVLFGLCPLARPDFVLFVGPALIGWFLWNKREALKAGGIAALVVAPWIIFTTAYYGSPVPNTIKAKALRYPVDLPHTIDPGTWLSFISDNVFARENWWHTWAPFLENGFVVDAPILTFFAATIAASILAFALSGAVISRSVPGWRPALVFIVLYGAYRLIALPEGYYEWYYPPFTALLVLCAGVGLTRLATIGPKTANGLALALVLLFAWPFPSYVIIDSRIQHNIENKVRRPMALWLRDNVPPGQTVTSESAGYVGYYGRVKLYDYPGLTSKETLKIMEKLGVDHNSLVELINAARPNFIVMRPNELQALQSGFPEAAAQYRPVRTFAVSEEASNLSWGGVTYNNIDRQFIVLRNIKKG